MYIRYVSIDTAASITGCTQSYTLNARFFLSALQFSGNASSEINVHSFVTALYAYAKWGRVGWVFLLAHPLLWRMASLSPPSSAAAMAAAVIPLAAAAKLKRLAVAPLKMPPPAFCPAFVLCPPAADVCPTVVCLLTLENCLRWPSLPRSPEEKAPAAKLIVAHSNHCHSPSQSFVHIRSAFFATAAATSAHRRQQLAGGGY